MLEKIQSRIVEMVKGIENTVAQHNFLSGAKQEAETLLMFYIEHRDQIDKIISEAPKDTLEAALDTIELIKNYIHGIAPPASVNPDNDPNLAVLA